MRRAAPGCPTGANRAKSPKRAQILEILRNNFTTQNRPTLVREIMSSLTLSRARANEIIHAMAKDDEILLLSTGTKGQAQQLLPLHALTPNPFLSGAYQHDSVFLKEFSDEMLMNRYCEALIEICKRKKITPERIREFSARYVVTPKSAG